MDISGHNTPDVEDIDAPPASAGLNRERTVRLGPVVVKLRSSGFDGAWQRFLVDASPGEKVDFTIICHQTEPGSADWQRYCAEPDKTFRAQRFSRGYYITDHFGEPVILRTRGTEFLVVGLDLERVVWPYLIKHILTIYSVDHRLLHLKAALVSRQGGGVLLIGRGGSGKTTSLAQLCDKGFSFVSNTHVLINHLHGIGIRTSLRVRNDGRFGSVIANGMGRPGIKPGEFDLDPSRDMGWIVADTATIRAICVLNYGRSPRGITRLGAENALQFADQFSLPLNTYGLKEDIFEHAGRDVARFSKLCLGMRQQLARLVHSVSCFISSLDFTEERPRGRFVQVMCEACA